LKKSNIERVEKIEDANMKLLFPYSREDIYNDETYVRKIFGDNRDSKYHPQVWKDNYGVWWKNWGIKEYKTKDEAIFNLDKCLIESGYTFITEERAEKFRKLQILK